jgi:hypothetical protein
VEKHPIVKIGGSVEQAKKGDYNLDVSAILTEAWNLTKQSRSAINIGLFICLLIGMVISMLVSSQMGGIEAVFQDPQAGTLLNIIVTLVVYPFVAGIEMMGVFHAVGLKTGPKLVFAFLKRGSWVAVSAILSSTLVTIGLSLFYFPGIFLAVALSLTLPLVIEKKMSPMKAVVLSIQSTRFQWFKIFSLYLILTLLLVLSLLPLALMIESEFAVVAVVLFLFCLSYIAPMFYNVKGILYREIFGLQLQSSSELPIIADDTFSA